MTEPASDLDVIDPTLLPPQIRTLVATIGIAETLRLLDARGGVPTYIPEDPSRSSLVDLLKPESVAALSSRFARERLDLPKADKMRKQLRDHYIREARRRGAKSGRQLAKELGLSWRMIKYISAEDSDQDTGDLFA